MLVSEKTEIVLNWANKNDILVQDSNGHWTIDQSDILSKTRQITNLKRFDSEGIQSIKSYLPTDNLIIRGNNLLVMNTLLEQFRAKINLIYIDPPYNTGNADFQYHDSFDHATWLTFMKNRLEIAWQLLANDGAIFIQTDDSEQAYLKVLCDELFGRQSFKENIVLKSSTESGVNAINVKRGERLFKVKEHILFYTKSPSFKFKPFYTKTNYNFNYKYEVKKMGNQFEIKNLSKIFENQSELEKYCLANPAHIYSLEKNIKKAGAKFKIFAEANKPKGLVEEFVNSKNQTVLVYDGGSLVPLRERIVSENGKNYFGVLASDLWVDIGTTAATEGGIKFPNGKKPEKLLKRIIEMTTKPNDLVLDFFLGSGTTAAVAHKLGRQYIGIEQTDYQEDDCTVRLQNVIKGDSTGISKSANWQNGGSFVYGELIP
jgi:adenine-specific DNA-methyltransferase